MAKEKTETARYLRGIAWVIGAGAILFVILLVVLMIVVISRQDYSSSRYILKEVVNLRSGPGTEHSILAQASLGRAVKVVGEEGKWLRVVFEQDTVWVYKELTGGISKLNQIQKKEEEQIEAPPQPREVVRNSAWDASVWQVEQWLKTNLKDPDSYEAIEWSKVVKRENRYMVRCKYRAKNSFGGYVIENKLFTLDSKGNVLSSTDYE